MITDGERESTDVSRGVLAWLASNPQSEGGVVVCCEACGTYGFDDEMEADETGHYCNPECRAEAAASLEPTIFEERYYGPGDTRIVTPN